MSNPLGAVGHFFAKLGHALTSLFGEDAVQKLQDATKELLKSALGQIAKAVVAETAGLLVSGPEKKALAFHRITSIAAAQGISVADSVVNLLIELVVQTVEKNKVA